MDEVCRFIVILEKAKEGGYVVICPGLPGLVTEGDSQEEALNRAADAIRGYLESLRKDGQPIPKDKPIPVDQVVRGQLEEIEIYVST